MACTGLQLFEPALVYCQLNLWKHFKFESRYNNFHWWKCVWRFRLQKRRPFCLGLDALIYIDGILPKGPYQPCLRIADRALLAGYPRYAALLSLFHVPNGFAIFARCRASRSVKQSKHCLLTERQPVSWMRPRPAVDLLGISHMSGRRRYFKICSLTKMFVFRFKFYWNLFPSI